MTCKDVCERFMAVGKASRKCCGFQFELFVVDCTSGDIRVLKLLAGSEVSSKGARTIISARDSDMGDFQSPTSSEASPPQTATLLHSPTLDTKFPTRKLTQHRQDGCHVYDRRQTSRFTHRTSFNRSHSSVLAHPRPQNCDIHTIEANHRSARLTLYLCFSLPWLS